MAMMAMTASSFDQRKGKGWPSILGFGCTNVCSPNICTSMSHRKPSCWMNLRGLISTAKKMFTYQHGRHVPHAVGLK